MTEQDAKDQLIREGFDEVMTVPVGAGYDLGQHVHHTHTVHLVVEGDMTIIDENGTKTYGPGGRIDVPAGQQHVARSEKGCIMVVGVSHASGEKGLV